VGERAAGVRLLPGDPDGTGFRLGTLQALTLRGGRIVEMTGFLDPGTHARFGLPGELAG